MKELEKRKVKLKGEVVQIGFRLNMAFCSPNFEQTTVFDFCRENVINKVFSFYGRKKVYSKGNNISTRKMKLLVAKRTSAMNPKRFVNDTNECMFNGLRLINHFEKIAKWRPTKLYAVDSDCLDRSHGVVAYLFVGSGKWMRSPHMVSLYMLLIRLGKRKEWVQLKSRNSFFEISEGLIKLFRKSWTYSSIFYDVTTHLNVTYKKIPVIMENFDKLFYKRSARHSFTKAITLTKLQYGEGITRLCSGVSADKEIEGRLLQIMREVKNG